MMRNTVEEACKKESGRAASQDGSMSGKCLKSQKDAADAGSCTPMGIPGWHSGGLWKMVKAVASSRSRVQAVPTLSMSTWRS